VRFGRSGMPTASNGWAWDPGEETTCSAKACRAFFQLKSEKNGLSSQEHPCKMLIPLQIFLGVKAAKGGPEEAVARVRGRPPSLAFEHGDREDWDLMNSPHAFCRRSETAYVRISIHGNRAYSMISDASFSTVWNPMRRFGGTGSGAISSRIASKTY
jgi:hypothetical protein